MLLAGGTSPAKFYRNASTKGGSLHFEAESSGLELGAVTGAYPMDVDSDGNIDLVLLRVGENVVMRGLGNCHFERANESWGFDGGDAWSTAFAATWEKGAEWPTLAIGNYINRLEETSPWGSCTDNWMHRPAVAGGKTQNKFAAPVALKPSYCALSMLFTDWNKSGTPSLRISNDREYYEGGQEQLWHVDAGQAPALYTEKEGWKPLRIWGMGIAGYDLDFDGYPEYFLTSMADNKLQTLATASKDGMPEATFKDVAFARGVTAHRPYTGDDQRPSTAWHTQFEDVNNDGLVDLFIAKGNVAKMPDFAMKDPNNLLLQGPDGKFQESGEAAGVASLAISRGGALADFNMDGLLDLVVVNRWENAQVWRNTSTKAGRWIEVKLQQPGANRDAIGAWLEVKRGATVMRREIFVGGGCASGQNGWWHFGLGDMAQAEVRVIWPDGTNGEWQSVNSDNFYILERSKPAQAWTVK
jgi:enediyne biosynthesis protein E4